MGSPSGGPFLRRIWKFSPAEKFVCPDSCDRRRERGRLCSSGTDETIHRLVETYSPMLLRLLTTHPTFREAEHEKAWLIRTTLHRACNIRKSAAQRNRPL